jgi:hypothetical protein
MEDTDLGGLGVLHKKSELVKDARNSCLTNVTNKTEPCGYFIALFARQNGLDNIGWKLSACLLE